MIPQWNNLAKINYPELVKSVQFRLRAIVAAAEKINSDVQTNPECDQSKQIIQSVVSDLDDVIIKPEEIDYYLSMLKCCISAWSAWFSFELNVCNLWHPPHLHDYFIVNFVIREQTYISSVLGLFNSTEKRAISLAVLFLFLFVDL